MCVAGIPDRTCTVLGLGRSRPGWLIIEVEITGWKKAKGEGARRVPQADDRRLVGKTVTLVPQSAANLLRRKSQKAWTRDTPGSWLTHARPRGPGADLPPEVADDVAGAAKAVRR
jgi:hypothetical protein